MSAVTASEMRSLEDAAIQAGSTEEQLMESAGEQLAHALSHFFPEPGTVIAYLGKGHNAGDALVALRFLRDRHHWRIGIRPAFPADGWAPLTRVKAHELGAVESFHAIPPWRAAERPLVLLDGLLGIGAKGALREPLIALSREMAWLRDHVAAKVAAIDLPSGIDGDPGEILPGAVTADVTFMIGAAKRGLLFEHAANATGALAIVEVEALTPKTGGEFQLITPANLDAGRKPRPYNFHKGQAGRVGILAGSMAYSGAAVLAATGALRGGAGLVTVHAPADAVGLIAAKCPPEVIVRSCGDPRELLELNYDALVIGCGLHVDDPAFRSNVLQCIAETNLPAVIDAEALNLLAEAGSFSLLKRNHLLTPHPGEFSRLAPDLKGTPREQAARLFADRTEATLLLKGCRTLVTRCGEPLWFNPTGTPAMATGGQGDFLSGVIGALLASGHTMVQAACLGAWACGRAAERALLDPNQSAESLLPTDVAGHLGGAFRDWAGRTR